MKIKTSRLETLRMIISSQELSSQEEVLQALSKEGYNITQATLSRDLKQLKVAKAASMNGGYVYVLPNETMYKRVSTPKSASEMLLTSGFISLNFSGNMADNIDSHAIPGILGTIAGDDTIFMVIEMGTGNDKIRESLANVIPDIE